MFFVFGHTIPVWLLPQLQRDVTLFSQCDTRASVSFNHSNPSSISSRLRCLTRVAVTKGIPRVLRVPTKITAASLFGQTLLPCFDDDDDDDDDDDGKEEEEEEDDDDEDEDDGNEDDNEDSGWSIGMTEPSF